MPCFDSWNSYIGFDSMEDPFYISENMYELYILCVNAFIKGCYKTAAAVAFHEILKLNPTICFSKSFQFSLMTQF